MSNQLIFNNYLMLLKSTVEVYVHGSLESCNDKVHNLLKECLNNTIDMQNNTFNLMTEYGWYQVENIDSSKIEDVYKKMDKYIEEESE